MIYETVALARDIRVALDQNAESRELLSADDIDTLTLDEIIRSKMEEAVKRVHLTAPNYMLECGHNFGDAVYWADKESGWVLLPEDFLRLVVFEMDDWERAVYSAISTEDAAYAKQRSRWKGIRGTAQSPVCAIAIRPEGRVLEFYSCKTDKAQVRRAVYCPQPVVDCNGGIDISERCYRAVVYQAAALVSVTLGQQEQSAAMAELSKTALEE